LPQVLEEHWDGGSIVGDGGWRLADGGGFLTISWK